MVHDVLGSPVRSLDVLNLFTHLFDEDLQIDRGLRDLGIVGFGSERVCLTIEFLHHEVQPASHRLVLPEDTAHLRGVGPV